MRSHPIASLSRQARRQQSCWELVEDLAFCSERYPRLAELAALLLFEQQEGQPLAPVDPALEALIPFRSQPPSRGLEPAQSARGAERITVFFPRRGRPIKKPRFIPAELAHQWARKLQARRLGTVSVL